MTPTPRLPATLRMDPPDGIPPVTFTRSEDTGVSATWEGDFILELTHLDGTIETVNLPTATLDSAIEAVGELMQP